MAGTLRQVLAESSRSDEDQVFTGFVLRVLLNGDPLSCLSDVLHGIIRDDTWWPEIKSLALDAFIRCQDSPGRTIEFKALLEDVRNGAISDPDKELVGTLLDCLYPENVPPSEVLAYLSPEWNLDLIGRYWRFWEIGLLGKSTDENVAQLLDNLCQELPRLQSALERRWFRHFPIKLLERGLEAYGDELDTKRIYDWIGVATFVRSTQVTRIGAWLERRPSLQKKIILEGLDRYPGTGNVRHYAYKVKRRLHGAIPADFGRWCLEQSVTLLESKPKVAGYLFEEAIYAYRHQRNDAGLSQKLIEEHADASYVFKTRLKSVLSPLRPPAG
jgi:hypothetical protein